MNNYEALIREIDKIRKNYIETLKKIIGIQEEIERTIFYLKNFGETKAGETINNTIEYIQELNKIRDEMTSLMKDNIITLKSFYKDIQEINLKTQHEAFSLLNQIYSNFVNMVIKSYNPFFWFK
ncbi:MAG TPA: hypothetical protein PKW55_08295 [Spirochaetota bacterium]|nr:hypothetical protein [Spirochaetota bacterium]HOM39075.1 hypothetical protein [Spirochaetota bacterium]HPQ49981.1 hypothetical protein [Spirochaetota bacterium]